MLHGDEGAIAAARESGEHTNFRRGIDEILSSRGLPPFLKVHRRHFLLFLEDHSFAAAVAEGRGPSRFIVIERHDRMAQAVSLYISAFTGQVSATSADWESPSTDRIPYEELELLRIYDSLTEGPRSTWAPLLNAVHHVPSARVAHVHYDELLSDDWDALQLRLERELNLKLPTGIMKRARKSSQLRPLTRQENAEFRNRLSLALKQRSRSFRGEEIEGHTRNGHQ